MTDLAIKARSLGRSFGDKNVVKGIDLSVAPGEIYGFLGPNGAGKTTLVRMLATLTMPTAGQALIMGRDVATEAAKVRTTIGATLQETTLDIKQTGRELLNLQGRLYGLSGTLIKKRVAELEELIDIGPAFDKMISTYSGGMKRRIDLAAGIIHLPRILFLDEPTTGLDPANRREVWSQIRSINHEHGMTVFLTTQYLEEADAIADRLGIIVDGRIVAEGTPNELKARIGNDVIAVKVKEVGEGVSNELAKIKGVTGVDIYDDEIAISTTDGATHVSSIAIALDKLKVEVRELTLRTPTLDDVFLKLTGARIADSQQQQED